MEMVKSFNRMTGKDRKKQILRVAQHVFAEDNYYGATIARIAEEADITEPTIYLYFKNKKELFIAVIEDCASFQLNALKRIIDNADDLKDALVNLIHEEYKFITQVTPDIEKIMNMARVINDPDIKACMLKYNSDVHELVKENIEKGVEEGVIRDDVDPDALSRILMGVVGGMRTMLLLDPPEAVDAIFIYAVDLFEKTILRE